MEKPENGFCRVMSSNVLNSNDPASMGWRIPYTARAEILARIYLSVAPDLLGLQEADVAMKLELGALLQDIYAFPPQKAEKNYTPLLYKKSRFACLDGGFCSFGGCWGYEWAVYRDRIREGERVIHVNLHYHYASFETRAPQAEAVNRKLKELRAAYPNVPIFVTGDYNCNRDSAEFRVMSRDLPLESGMLLTSDNDGYSSGWHRLGETVPRDDDGAIDHISVMRDTVTVKAHRQLRSAEAAEATDHFPIWLDTEPKEETEDCI